jgi:uncharacterized membrane protein
LAAFKLGVEDVMETNPIVTEGATVETMIPGGRTVDMGRGLTWIQHGWTAFMQAPLMWIVNMVIFIVIYIVISSIPFVGALICHVLTAILGAGLMLAAHGLRSGRTMEATDLFGGFKAPLTSPLITTGVIYMAAWLTVYVICGLVFLAIFGMSGAVGTILSGDPGAIAGMLAGAGLGVLVVALLMVALSLPIVAAIWFAPALVAISNVAPVEALRASLFGCLRNILPSFIYGLIFLVLIIIGSIPFGLGLLVVLPLMITSTYAAYRDIFLGDNS